MVYCFPSLWMTEATHLCQFIVWIKLLKYYLSPVAYSQSFRSLLWGESVWTFLTKVPNCLSQHITSSLESSIAFINTLLVFINLTPDTVVIRRQIVEYEVYFKIFSCSRWVARSFIMSVAASSCVICVTRVSRTENFRTHTATTGSCYIYIGISSL